MSVNITDALGLAVTPVDKLKRISSEKHEKYTGKKTPALADLRSE